MASTNSLTLQTNPAGADAAQLGDQDALGSSFLMQNTPMNASIMAEIFHELVDNLPQVFDTLQEPIADGASTMLDDATLMPAVNGSAAHSEADVNNSAIQFATSHPTPLAVLFQDFGMDGWVRFCNRLTLSYVSRAGTESLRAFLQRRLDDIISFVVSEYEEIVREGGAPLEDQVITINNAAVRTCIDTPAFLRLLVEMVSGDIPRVVYAAWLEAAKSIVDIICPQSVFDQSAIQAHQLCSRVTHNGVPTYNFFHDLPEDPNSMVVLFNGTQAWQMMALALRNITPLLNGTSPNTFFGIYNRVRGSDGTLQFHLLETSSTHTTNLVSSMVILVLDTHYVRRRQFPAMSERKMSDLKVIYNFNRLSFRNIVACSQDDIPRHVQELARRNLLNILPNSVVF